MCLTQNKLRQTLSIVSSNLAYILLLLNELEIITFYISLDSGFIS